MPTTTNTAAAVTRLCQRRPHPGRRATTPELYDPDIASDGLSVDSPLGPVDLVAVERVLAGRPAPLTLADLAYLYAHRPPAHEHIETVAAALGVRPDTVKRAVERHRHTPPRTGDRAHARVTGRDLAPAGNPS